MRPLNLLSPMNHYPEAETPEKPKDVRGVKLGRSFDELLKDIRPSLDKLPVGQAIPPVPPDHLALKAIQEFVQRSGMVSVDTCPPSIALAGEFLDRSLLREGRVGLYQNVRVLSFLVRYTDKRLRAVVLSPRDGVDARLLGMAIFWGVVADVPETVAQSQILETYTFFEINSFDLSKVIDVPALNRFKLQYRQEMEENAKASRRSAEVSIAALEAERVQLLEKCNSMDNELHARRNEEIAQHNRAEHWKFLTACAGFLGFVIALVLRHFLA